MISIRGKGMFLISSWNDIYLIFLSHVGRATVGYSPYNREDSDSISCAYCTGLDVSLFRKSNDGVVPLIKPGPIFFFQNPHLVVIIFSVNWPQLDCIWRL